MNDLREVAGARAAGSSTGAASSGTGATASAPSPLPSLGARRLETRTKLLDAAVEVFAEAGLQGASVLAICSRAGFTRGAFYSNFRSKEQLFLALLEREFAQRADNLRAKANELEPVLREQRSCISPPQAANYIVDFFAPSHDATAWFVLEAEFLLLAMRDPSIAPGYHDFMERFYADIAGVVERVITAAGRRFSMPVENAMPVLSGVYERALQSAALRGNDGGSVAFETLGERLAELLFAITEDAATPAAPQPAATTLRRATPGDPPPISPGFTPPKRLRLF